MNKKTIYIGLEYIFGPIQKLTINDKGEEITGVNVIDNDVVVQSLDLKINDMWCSLFIDDENSTSGFRFDYAREKELAPTLLDLIFQLINRLNQINDGSYVVKDMISEHLKSLL